MASCCVTLRTGPLPSACQLPCEYACWGAYTSHSSPDRAPHQMSTTGSPTVPPLQRDRAQCQWNPASPSLLSGFCRCPSSACPGTGECWPPQPAASTPRPVPGRPREYLPLRAGLGRATSPRGSQGLPSAPFPGYHVGPPQGAVGSVATRLRWACPVILAKAPWPVLSPGPRRACGCPLSRPHGGQPRGLMM